MNTDELITLLATRLEPVDRRATILSSSAAVALAVIVSCLLMTTLLGVRPDLGLAVGWPKFWVKVGFVAGLAWCSLQATARLSQPGRRLQWVPYALVAPVLSMWAIAGTTLVLAEPTQRTNLFFGTTWAVCPLLIALLSVPVFVAVFWTLRQRAPTRLTLAGAAAGLLAGSIGALVYCLHCPELEAPFLAFWYLLGMLIPAIVGAVAGRVLLRW